MFIILSTHLSILQAGRVVSFCIVRIVVHVGEHESALQGFFCIICLLFLLLCGSARRGATVTQTLWESV